MSEKVLSVSEIKDIIDKQYHRNRRMKYTQRRIEDMTLLSLLIGDYLIDKELNIENEEVKNGGVL